MAAQSPESLVIPPGGTPIPQIAPVVPPVVGPDTGRAPVAPAATPSDAGSVSIRGVVFEGATAFPAERLTAATGPLTGPSVPVASLETARASIVSLYREAGYPFVTADAVVGADGVLRFRITEGHVTEVQLDGDIGPAGTQVLRFLNRLIGPRPLDIETLERQLLLAQDMPGIAIRTVLRPAGTEPGALSLVAQVSRRAVTGFVTGDNRGSRLTGPAQFLGAAQFNSFTEFGERTELAVFYADGDTQLFGQVASEAYVGGSGLRVRLYAGRGRATPNGVLQTLGYRGETTVGGLSATYPLIRSRSQSLNLVGAFDVIDSDIDIDDANRRRPRFSRDALRVVRLGGDWAVFDLLAGDSRPASNFFVLRLSQGIDGLGARSGEGPDASRAGARAGFTKIGGEATRTQALFPIGTQATVSLLGTVAGQWTNDVLPPSEKFYLGGNRLGRGFYTGEVTGDRAIAVSAELQVSTTVETEVFGQALRFDPTAYAFYDYGKTFENLSSDPNRHLASVGIGLRTVINERFEAGIEGVHRLTRHPGGASLPAQKEDALFWRFLARF
ncbi:ShlB/FhaC/HecB family hemolysin secretion/activation protein [Pararoseomonas indoligenes]|uniref:ShlB/FhaC/HecB family hemolysin secretion/activation protein n=1 Tax=Roseomonas indoligenes TaxID=2820811 RepID=A0A940S6B0_9PROT|nr:ShlB/FhaC/HecB family hemolysin secretion/activation protein [Pararoseomonas indoligenes]MBP0491773.1 ShlB/FhaC/HecB family hemolysin secretion/activation protein [Pararoseomonas indoligenes]